MVGNPLFALRRADQRGRIALEDAFPPQVLPEGADRRQLPRRGGFRVAPLIAIAEERARVEMIERSGGQIRNADVQPRREERKVLRKIALVGTNGVRRGVLVQAEMFEKRLEVFSNQSSRSFRARSAIARLRSFLPRGAFSSIGMRPNAIFDGT